MEQVKNYRYRVIEAANVLYTVLDLYGHTHLRDCVQQNISHWSDPHTVIAKSNLRYAAAVAVHDMTNDLIDIYDRTPEFIHDGYVGGNSIRRMLNKIVLYFL